jgi:outer membrane protein TolC
MEGLLNLIQESMERAKGPGKFLPVFEVRLAEGGFGAGPGDQMTWDNRFDLGLQARWNLTALASAKDRQRAAHAKAQQAHLAYQDLRAKLTAGVQEARESILGGREEIETGSAQIGNAQEAFKLTDLRLKENPQAGSFGEALLALGTLARARANYVSSIRDFDKAQLRLMMLLGPGACKGAAASTPP